MTWTQTVLDRYTEGVISREIALAQLLLSGEVPDADALPAPIADLARAHRGSLTRLSDLARDGFDASDPASAAALFDRLASTAPEAGVAFYSFGDPALLARATDELVAVIQAWALVEGRCVLDFGCGIGRVAAALAPLARDVIGVDVSGGMIEQARARASAPNLRFEQSDGRTLAMSDASIDIVVAADSWPFLVQADILDTQLAEIARVLTRGGDLLVFNWSYRGDDAADVAEAHAVAARHGFSVQRAGERPFAIWDGRGFHLRRG